MQEFEEGDVETMQPNRSPPRRKKTSKTEQKDKQIKKVKKKKEPKEK